MMSNPTCSLFFFFCIGDCDCGIFVTKNEMYETNTFFLSWKAIDFQESQAEPNEICLVSTVPQSYRIFAENDIRKVPRLQTKNLFSRLSPLSDTADRSFE